MESRGDSKGRSLEDYKGKLDVQNQTKEVSNGGSLTRLQARLEKLDVHMLDDLLRNNSGVQGEYTQG